MAATLVARCVVNFSPIPFPQSSSDGTVTRQKLKLRKRKAEIRRELHKLTRIDSVACQKNKLVAISEIRVKGFMPVARMLRETALQWPFTTSPNGR
jgi:hypothetical protein